MVRPTWAAPRGTDAAILLCCNIIINDEEFRYMEHDFRSKV